MKRITLYLLLILVCTPIQRLLAQDNFSGANPGAAQTNRLNSKISLENRVLIAQWDVSQGFLECVQWTNRLTNETCPIRGNILFSIELSDGSIFTNKDFSLDGKLKKRVLTATDSLPSPALHRQGLQLSLKLRAPKNKFRLEWKAILRDGANYIRQEIIVHPINQAIAVRRITFFDQKLDGATCTGSVLGSPIVYRNFFFGMEQPIAHSKALFTRTIGKITNQKINMDSLLAGNGTYVVHVEHGGGDKEFNILSATLYQNGKKVNSDVHKLNGTGSHTGNRYHLELSDYSKTNHYEIRMNIENPEKATGLLHWYKKTNDVLNFYMNRVDTLHIGDAIAESLVMGIAPKKQMRRAFSYYIGQERARAYKPFLHYNCWWDITDDGASSFTSEQFIERMHAWDKLFMKPYHITLNSFVFDDGWDDMDGKVWYFHPKKFPTGFAPQAKLCKEMNTGIGVWMSPFGGYLGAQQQRIATAKREGLEVNTKGLSLAGKNYYNRFLERATNMITKYHVNYFKFDGFGGSEPEFLPDMEAGIRLIKSLRHTNPELFVNITVGTWPSPFWLRYADCTWRASGDLHQAGEGDGTQQFMTYRDGTLHNNIVNRATLYPLNSIMTVGIAYANLGHPNHFITDSKKGFKDMVRSHFASGSCLQELYISPNKMKPEFWSILAEAVHWAKKEVDVLWDTHWIGGSPINLEVYGFASWNGIKGVLSLRNPSKNCVEYSFDLEQVLELQHYEHGIYSLKSPWKEDAIQKAILTSSDQTVKIKLEPFDCLVFEINPIKK